MNDRKSKIWYMFWVHVSEIKQVSISVATRCQLNNIFDETFKSMRNKNVYLFVLLLLIFIRLYFPLPMCLVIISLRFGFLALATISIAVKIFVWNRFLSLSHENHWILNYPVRYSFSYFIVMWHTNHYSRIVY